MVADDRSSPVSNVASSASRAPSVEQASQSASFAVGGLELELSAAPGAARLVVASGGNRDIYVVDPAALAGWSAAASKLIGLIPARSSAERVEFRTPFLIDREGRESVALEGLVSELGVSYRLLVSGAAGRVAGMMITVEVLRGIAEAAAGAVSVAERSSK